MSPETDQFMRLAARYGFDFHINQYGYLVEHAGWKSEERPATEYEKELWGALFPWFREWIAGGMQTLDATEGEILHNLIGPGPMSISPEDAWLVLCDPVRFTLRRGEDGIIGFFNNNDAIPIHVSELVPKGYVYHGIAKDEDEVRKGLRCLIDKSY